MESLREELAKSKNKEMALSVGEQAIEPSGRISEGKLELQKLLKIFLDKDQKTFFSRRRVELINFPFTER